MKLVLLTPKATLFEGVIDSVTIPGSKGQFTVLERHASMITTLTKGYVSYEINDKVEKLMVDGGFAEIKDNIISICIEKVITELDSKND